MEIDVVIPVKNEEIFLPKCLSALKAQTIPVHPIVVNNKSTDRSVTIAQEFGATIIHEEQLGIGAAKKAGLLASTTPLVLMIDADTFVSPCWAEILTTKLPTPEQLAVVYSPALYHDADSLGLEIYSRLAVSGRFLMWMLNKPHYQGNSCAFTAKIRTIMAMSDDPQAGEGGRIFKSIRHEGGSINWIWHPKVSVLTSARRVKEKGLISSFTRRAIHLSTGNSDIAYKSFYNITERGIVDTKE